jgi:hypothetical protein
LTGFCRSSRPWAPARWPEANVFGYSFSCVLLPKTPEPQNPIRINDDKVIQNL